VPCLFALCLLVMSSSAMWMLALTPVMLSGTVFINRGNNKSAIASMQQAGEDMKGKRVSLSIGRAHSDFALDLPRGHETFERRG